MDAWYTPVMPPTVNIERKPIAYNIGVWNEMLPRQSVASQLKILTPVGTATAMVASMNGTRAVRESPVVNMWWAHTRKPTNPMPKSATAIDLYPKIGLCAIFGITSLIAPIAGRTMMYTAGCE